MPVAPRIDVSLECVCVCVCVCGGGGGGGREGDTNYRLLTEHSLEWSVKPRVEVTNEIVLLLHKSSLHCSSSNWGSYQCVVSFIRVRVRFCPLNLSQYDGNLAKSCSGLSFASAIVFCMSFIVVAMWSVLSRVSPLGSRVNLYSYSFAGW